MSVEFAKLIAVYGADTSGFDAAATKVTGTMEKQANVANVAFGSFFGNMMSQATSAVMGMAGEAVTSCANFERLGMSVQSLTAREMLNSGAAHTMTEALKQAGPAAQQTLQWIQKLAIQSPFTSDGVASAYRQAQAYGFAGDEAKKLTQDLIDFAAGSGASEGVMNSIALALGQVKAKGHLAGGEILQLVNTGLPVLSILAKAFGKSTAEIQTMVSAGLIPADAAIKAISQSIENDFGGAAARQTHTFAGLLSSLQDVKEIGLREFFTGTFQTIQPYLDQFTSSMQDPATLAAIRGWGQDLGFYVGQGAQAIVSLAGAWQGLGSDAQSAILHMGGLAVILPTLGQVAGAGLQAVTAMAGLAEAAGAAVSAWQAGLTLTTALQVGFGATAVAVGAVTIALAALVAMWWAYNEQITKTQQQGMTDNMAAWAHAFDDVKAKGGSASDVLAVYEQHVKQINAQHEAGGLIADVFVDKQQILMTGFQQTLEVLKSQSTSYEDYRSKSEDAAKAIGLMIDANGNLVKSVGHRGGATMELVQADALATKGMYDAVKGGAAYDTELQKMKEGAYGGKAAILDMGKAVVETKDILGGLSSTLKDAGFGADEIARMTDDVKVAMGDLSPATRQAQDDVSLLTKAFADHILTQDGYISKMQEAKDGTLALSDAERASLETRVASAETSREAAQAAREGATAYWGLAESLKGAGQAEIARQAIAGLTKLMNDTKGDPAAYAAAIEGIGKAYGLMDDKSIALAGALPQFNKLLADGVIPAKNAASALDGLNQEAADGVVDWAKFLEQFGTTPEEAARIAGEISTKTGDALSTGAPAVAAGMKPWKDEASKVVDDMGKQFRDQDWAGLGGGIGTEISNGILDAIPEMVAAAGQAATEAMNAAQAAINSWTPPAPPTKGKTKGSEISLQAINESNSTQYGTESQTYNMGNRQSNREGSDESGIHFHGPVTFVVPNRQTLDDVMREMRVKL